MGLKKGPAIHEPGNAANPAAARTPPPEQPPSKPPAKPPPKAATKDTKAEGRQVMLLAVHNSIGDPITGIKYQVNGPMPGVVKENNWLYAQIKAGILKEVGEK